MGVIYFDGFDSYSASDLGDRWTVSGSWTVLGGGGRHGTSCLVTSSVAGGTIARDLGTGLGHVVVGFGFNWSGTLASGGYFRICKFGGAEFGQSYDHGLVIKNASGVDVVATGSMVPPNQWFYVELDLPIATVGAAIGAIKIRLNGSAVTGNTATATIGGPFTASSFQFGGGGGAAGLKVDDFYISNGSMLGVCRCETVRPASDGTNAGFTSLSGSHASNVDEATNDSDGSYVSSSTVYSPGDPGNRDTYVMDTLPSDPAIVHCVQVVSRSRVETGGIRTIANAVRSGGTDYDSTNQLAPTTSYKILLSKWDTNPNGNVPWTGDGVHAAEVGFHDVP